MDLILGDRKCTILGNAGPVLLCGISSYDRENKEKIRELTAEKTAADFTLFFFETRDWNYDFSPWEAETDKPFPGGGPQVLDWLKNTALPYCRKTLGASEFYIAGYSLAGLFALWALYVCPEFSGAACVSGSLWFPGWEEFSEKNLPGQGRLVYLSVGGKESASKDPWMCTIGDKYRSEDRRLKAAKVRHTFQQNPGGHFANPENRLAKGLAWLLENRPKEPTQPAE